MKVLVIDDVRVLRLDPEWDVTYARTSTEAIDILGARRKWDIVMWDHDLGGEYGKFNRYDTVMPVVTWLEETIYFGYKPDIGECIIITANPAGAQVLNAVLSRHYPTKQIDVGRITERILRPKKV